MEIEVKPKGTTTIVSLKGDFLGEDHHIALRECVGKLVTQQKKDFIVDLGGVQYINSSGLGSLVAVLTTVRRAGGDLRLACLQTKVVDVVDLTNLGLIFEVFPTVDSALR